MSDDERLILFVKQQVARALVGLLEFYGFEVDSSEIRDLVESYTDGYICFLGDDFLCNTTSPAGAAPESLDCVTNKRGR